MSALLRHPASVPALFSRGAEAELWADPRALRQRESQGCRRLLIPSRGLAQGAASAAASAMLLLTGAPLVKAATHLLSLSLAP